MFQNKKSKNAVTASQLIGIFQTAVGSFLTFIFGITTFAIFVDLLSADVTTEADGAIVIIILFILFVYLLISGIRRLKFINTYNYYIQVLSQRPTHSIDELSIIFKSPVHIVRNNLQKMIRKRFLYSAYIDNRTNSIIYTDYQQSKHPMPGPVPVPMQTQYQQMPTPVQQMQVHKPMEYITVACKNCGASIKILKGTSGECEYCGTNVS